MTNGEPDEVVAGLPCSGVVHFQRGEDIFGYLDPPASLYLVIRGKVSITTLAADGSTVLLDIYGAGDFFGETALLGCTSQLQTAAAMDEVDVMRWSVTEIEDLVAHRPRLAIGLMQFLVGRTTHLAERLQSFCVDNISQRLARALMRFSDRFEEPTKRAGFHLPPLTHLLLAQYVGTSREVVTQHMNRLRALGLLRYTRGSIWVNREATAAWLNAEPATNRIETGHLPRRRRRNNPASAAN
jgi:CRP-like cAMP-binding protein